MDKNVLFLEIYSNLMAGKVISQIETRTDPDEDFFEELNQLKIFNDGRINANVKLLKLLNLEEEYKQYVDDLGREKQQTVLKHEYDEIAKVYQAIDLSKEELNLSDYNLLVNYDNHPELLADTFKVTEDKLKQDKEIHRIKTKDNCITFSSKGCNFKLSLSKADLQDLCQYFRLDIIPVKYKLDNERLIGVFSGFTEFKIGYYENDFYLYLNPTLITEAGRVYNLIKNAVNLADEIKDIPLEYFDDLDYEDEEDDYDPQDENELTLTLLTLLTYNEALENYANDNPNEDLTEDLLNSEGRIEGAQLIISSLVDEEYEDYIEELIDAMKEDGMWEKMVNMAYSLIGEGNDFEESFNTLIS